LVECLVGRKPRRAQAAIPSLDLIAPGLSRAVDVPPRRLWIGRKTITFWAMQHARMAQIRRDPPRRGGIRLPAPRFSPYPSQKRDNPLSKIGRFFAPRSATPRPALGRSLLARNMLYLKSVL
jgi:hypothetical protein